MAEQPCGCLRCLRVAALLPPVKGMWMPRVENEQIVESTNEARAAVTGHNARYVLLIGTLTVILLFAIVYVMTR